MQLDDEAEIRQIDNAWNEAYVRNDRWPLDQVLADDFSALNLMGEAFDKAALMVNPPAARSVQFSEQFVRVFGSTAISRGRLQLEFDDRKVDQRFLRVYARRDGRWQAVSVAVTPVPA
jgi:ketosteroid isomerase-like protein